MAHRGKILFCAFMLAILGCTDAQMPDSAGQAIGGLTKALSAMLKNTSTIETISSMFGNTGDTFQLDLNSDLAKTVLLKLRSQDATIGIDCLQHVGIMVQGLMRREDWALRMIDAIGKPPRGLLTGKLSWRGDWNECLSTEATVYQNVTTKSNPTHPFTGKYCNVIFPIPIAGMFGVPTTFTLGTCFPNTCTSSDVTVLALTLVDLLPKDMLNVSIPEPTVSCQEKSLVFDGQAIAVIIVCSMFLVVMTFATLYDVLYVHWLATNKTRSKKVEQNGISNEKTPLPDVYVVENGTTANQNGAAGNVKPETTDAVSTPKSKETEVSAVSTYKPSNLEGILLSFSMFTNGTKILNTRQPKGALTAVNGIRFISMTWVIVGHSIMMGMFMGDADNSLQYGMSLLKRVEFMPIINGTFSVDTFFVLSGLLVSYLSLKELNKRGGVKKFNWGLYYFHRFWRLTPPYMLILMLWISLNAYIANGPAWNQLGDEKDACRKTWWTNLLYINNLVDEEDSQCFGVAWYLANDMQFYVIAPLALIPLYLSPILGGLACLALVLTSTISSGVLSWKHNLPLPTKFDRNWGGWNVYVKPWCRVGPYAVGMFTGYLLYRYKLKMKINQYVNLLLWAVSITLGCLLVYGLYTPDMSNPMTTTQTNLYNATFRTVWGACVAWVIFACANGYGGPVNHVLSWPGFVPLGRLTYFAYLAHPLLQLTYHSSQLSTHTAYDLSTVYVCLGDICMAYAAAFVLSLAFEAPMMGLEKVFLGRDKHS